MGTCSVAVVGGGVVGLSAALALLERGAQVQVFAPATGPRAASTVAPAGFTPYPGVADDRLRAWTTSAFNHFASLAAHDLAAGIQMLHLREYCSRPAWTTPWLDRLLQPRGLPTPPGWHSAVVARRPHIDTDRYLPWLRGRIAARGGTISPRRIDDLAALFSEGFDVVVNAAGLGARTLAADDLLAPVRGQVVHVPNDIGLDYSLHDDAPHGLVAYIFVYADRIVLGGTYDRDTDGDEVAPATTHAIIARCRDLLRTDGHPRWADLGRTVLDVRAAARPCRGRAETTELIRLESELTPRGHIVHNYGHGRSGVTLSWGCAQACADLALAGAPEPVRH